MLLRPLKNIFSGPKQITHSDIWAILTAVARKDKIAGKTNLDVWLSSFCYDRTSLVRNRILYDSSYWPTDFMTGAQRTFSSFSAFTKNVVRVKQSGPYSDYYLSMRCLQILEIAEKHNYKFKEILENQFLRI